MSRSSSSRTTRPPCNCLGQIITQQQLHHHFFSLKVPKRCALGYSWQVLGYVNREHPYLPIAGKDLALLSKRLSGESQFNSIRKIIPEAERVPGLLNNAAAKGVVH